MRTVAAFLALTVLALWGCTGADPSNNTCCTSNTYSVQAIEQKAVADNSSLRHLYAYLDANHGKQMVFVDEVLTGAKSGYLARGDLKMFYTIDFTNSLCKTMTLDMPVLPVCVGVNSTNPHFRSFSSIGGIPVEIWTAEPVNVPAYGDFFIKRYPAPAPDGACMEVIFGTVAANFVEPAGTNFFFNWTNTVDDQSVFDVPSFC